MKWITHIAGAAFAVWIASYAAIAFVDAAQRISEVMPK